MSAVQVSSSSAHIHTPKQGSQSEQVWQKVASQVEKVAIIKEDGRERGVFVGASVAIVGGGLLLIGAPVAGAAALGAAGSMAFYAVTSDEYDDVQCLAEGAFGALGGAVWVNAADMVTMEGPIGETIQTLTAAVASKFAQIGASKGRLPSIKELGYAVVGGFAQKLGWDYAFGS